MRQISNPWCGQASRSSLNRSQHLKKDSFSFCLKFMRCFLKVLVLWGGKNFFKNLRTISFQVVIELALRECSHHALALSFKEKGNNLNLITSSLTLFKWRVAHTSSSSFKWRYALSESRPWNLGNSWITPGLISKFPAVAGTTIHEGAVVLVGCRYSSKDLLLWLTTPFSFSFWFWFLSLLLLLLLLLWTFQIFRQFPCQKAEIGGFHPPTFFLKIPENFLAT